MIDDQLLNGVKPGVPSAHGKEAYIFPPFLFDCSQLEKMAAREGKFQKLGDLSKKQDVAAEVIQ